MGCATSKIENEEVVALCATRKRQIREAVRARHTFAAAFSNYVIALRTVGSAFSQFGEAEFRDAASPTSSAANNTAFNTPVKTPVAKPPPMPNFYSGQQNAAPTPMPPVLDPLQRSISLPALNLERKTVNKTGSGNVQKGPAADSTASPAAPTGKVSRTSSKKKMKTPPSPSPEPETPEPPKNAGADTVVHDEADLEEEEQKSVHVDVKAASVTSTESVNHHVKVSDEGDDDWVPMQPPPPPVPSNKPPPPPPPPRSGWDFDLFSYSHPEYTHPADTHDEDFEESDRKKQEDLQKLQEADEKRRKLEQQLREKEEEERELKRKADEEVQRQLELEQRQREQMRRRPSTVDEGEEGEEEEEDDEEDEEDEEVEEEDGEEEVEEGEEEEEEDKTVSFEEEKKAQVEHEEPQKKTVNYDLPKKDLAIVTNQNKGGREELGTVLRKIDDHFQVAYESGRPVASMLEANRVSFHPNFIDSRSDETHAKKVLKAISWTSSSKSEPRPDVPMDDDNNASGTHAATLDKLLAWEKKLFDEVKSAESIRVDLEKKNAWIVKEENRGGNPEAIEKAKQTVKSLTTRFMVAIQGVETARSNLLKLRDSELYPQLLELLNKIYEMWKITYECHSLQYDQIMQMKKLDVSDVVESTNNLHKVATEQLKVALSRWHNYFGSVVSSHRDYLHFLNLYVKVSVKGLDIEKDRPLVSPASSRYPISALCHEWQLALDRLPDKRALEAINNFVQELQSIVDMQKEESRHRKRIEQLEEEVRIKEKSLQKYMKKHLKSFTQATSPVDVSGSIATGGSDGEVSSGSVASIDMLKERTPMIEKQAQLEVLKRRLEEEREKVDDLSQKSKHKTINSLQMGLPNIFYAARAFSKQCLDAHHDLHEFANTRLITDK